MSSFNKIMAWLGLVDDEDPGNDPYQEQGYAVRGNAPSAVPRRPVQRPQMRPSESGHSAGGPRLVGGSSGYRRPGPAPDMSVLVRPGEQAGSTVGYTETIEARGFDDAKRIADLMRERIPVVIDLRETGPVQVRRLVDFSSGLVYALDGSIRKVAEGVLLVTPPRVKILEREINRLAELGLYDLDR